MLPRVKHRSSRYPNNRAETRGATRRRERQMQRFKSSGAGPALALPSWLPLSGTKWLGQAGGMLPHLASYPGYRFPAEIIQPCRMALSRCFSLQLAEALS